jgi:hypothetical protein
MPGKIQKQLNAITVLTVAWCAGIHVLETCTRERLIDIRSGLELFTPFSRIARCDICWNTFIRSRVVCLDCDDQYDPGRLVYFCSKPECIASKMHRGDLHHHPSQRMVRIRDILLLKAFQEIKRRAGSTLETACSFYHEVAGDPSLTVPLPTSPVADDTPPSETNSTSSTADIQTQVHMIVDDTPTPTPIAAQRMATPVGLIALDTDISVDLTSEQPPATPSSSSDTTELLSKAVTPEEEILWEDERLNCVQCHTRVVAPCWSCISCYSERNFLSSPPMPILTLIHLRLCLRRHMDL